MGSSPVTATTLLLSGLRSFFDALLAEARPSAVPGIVVGLSGGIDSTALLFGLKALEGELGLAVSAAHLDHGLDLDSRARQQHCAALAARLAVPFASERLPVPALRRAGESLEAAGRRLRYEFLERVRRERSADYIATAHHLDDQAETVLLRLLFGSGLEGLAAILAVRGPVLRPLLGRRRTELEAAIRELGLPPAEDPSNRDTSLARNRIRHLLLPSLLGEDAALPPRLAALAAGAARLNRALAAELRRRLRPVRRGAAWGIELGGLLTLPAVLQPWALSLLNRQAGVPHPPSQEARAELARQLGAGSLVGCDCGGGWRWEVRRGRLELLPGGTPEPAFFYTLRVPGEVELVELGMRVRLSEARFAAWMLRPEPTRAGLALPLVAGDTVELRSRRPGDRVQPFGSSHRVRLKDLLINRGVPRRERGRLPLLVVDGTLCWVPGVTIAEPCRVLEGARVWVAELLPAR